MKLLYSFPFKSQSYQQQKLPQLKSNFSNKSLLHSKIDAFDSLRGYGKDIFSYIYSFKNASFIKLTNKTIAQRVGCDVRTVKRWTKRFVQEGILTKHQQDYFTPNTFLLSKPENNKASFSLWFKMLSPDQQQIYMTHGKVYQKENSSSSHYETVTPTKNINLNIKFIYKPSVNARAREDGLAFFKKRERLTRVMKGIAMLSAEQKKWILSHKDHPEVRKIIEQPRIQALLFSGIIQTITKTFGFGQREQLKLIAFDDDILSYVLHEAEKAFTNKTPIRSMFGWFISLCEKTAQKNGIKPDWGWYFEICKIVGIEPIHHDEPEIKKPIKREGKGIYASWKSPEKPLVRTTIAIAQSLQDTDKLRSNLSVFMSAPHVEETIRKIVIGYLKEEYLTPATPAEHDAERFIAEWRSKIEGESLKNVPESVG